MIMSLCFSSLIFFLVVSSAKVSNDERFPLLGLGSPSVFTFILAGISPPH